MHDSAGTLTTNVYKEGFNQSEVSQTKLDLNSLESGSTQTFSNCTKPNRRPYLDSDSNYPSRALDSIKKKDMDALRFIHSLHNDSQGSVSITLLLDDIDWIRSRRHLIRV